MKYFHETVRGMCGDACRFSLGETTFCMLIFVSMLREIVRIFSCICLQSFLEESPSEKNEKYIM